MIIKPSPLVASFHGSAGEATASTWLGRNYLRKRVTPRNPQSDAQTAVRTSMTRLVQLWQSFTGLNAEVPWKAAWNYIALREALKGYNSFVKQNRILEQAASELILLAEPKWTAAYGGTIPTITDFAAVAGASGEIDFTWTSLSGAGYSYHIYARKAETNILTNPTGYAGEEAAESGAITGLTPDTEYQLYMLIMRNADAKYSASAADTESSGA